jgi:hypothetical protein
MSRARGTTWGLAAALALAALAPACTSVGAQAHNLEALHTPDGLHHFEAVLYSGFEWEFRQGVKQLMPTSQLALQEKQTKVLDDPCEVCLEELVQLQRADPSDRYAVSLRLQHLVRWSSDCPWVLSRERCLKGLMSEAQRLDLRRNPVPAPAGEPVGPDALGDALAQLVAALRPALTEDLSLDLGAVETACERVRALTFDLAASRRALAMVSLLDQRAPEKQARFEPLRQLHLELQRIAVQRALSAALIDRAPFERSGSHSGWESPRVRAMAITACSRGLGPGALAELLATRMGPREDAEILRALAGEVEHLGRLPIEESGLPEAERDAWRERWIDSFVALATTHPDGSLRLAAMRALGAISGGELASLREEDWLEWRTARRQAARNGAASTEAG